MNSGTYAIVTLVVDLWECELLSLLSVNASLAQISHTGGVDHISDDVLSDSFILGHSSGARFASYKLDVSSALLVTSVVSSLLGHFVVFFCIFGGFI
jgi:hypothetical protein